jgi:Flp pilus assembly protein TadG
MDYRFCTRPTFAARVRHHAEFIRRAYLHARNTLGARPRMDKSMTSGPTPGSKGQAMVLIGVAMLVLLAIGGLVVDVGQLYIYYGHLKRAVDAASLAASGQYREGRTIDEMEAAASQTLALNGISGTVIVQTCDEVPGDPRLCTDPPRKLVRVIGGMDVPTVFLQLVGVNALSITSNSVAEAASMDVVVVIDISESMAWDSPSGNPLRDPSYCNTEDAAAADGFPGECQPFEEVKRAAINFVNRILDKPEAEEQDRVSIITLANGWNANVNEGTHIRIASGWTFDRDEAINTIRGLTVFQADTCYTPSYDPNGTINRQYGPCRYYECTDPNWVGNGGANATCNPGNIEYRYMDCLSCRKEGWIGSPFGTPTWDYEFSTIPTTKIGGGLLRAGNMFALDTRLSALWVVVLISDGMANTTDLAADDIITDFHTYPIGFCPNTTAFPLCVDWDTTTRHSSGDFAYDAEDYARDMADFVGCFPLNPADACNGLTGQGAIMFTVGLGNGVLDTTNEVNGIPYGGALLRYIARVGYLGDPDPANDPCLEADLAGDYTEWCGNYYFSPTGNQLVKIFEDIASRIFTRLVQ